MLQCLRADLWRAALALTAGLLLVLGTLGCAPTTSRAGGRSTTATALPTQAARLVTLATDHTKYYSTQVISVTVQNVTSSPLYATEQYSACTMLTLQFRTKGAWQTVQPCVGGPQPQVRLLPPKVAFPLSFGPGNAPDDPNLWQLGTYRFVLQFGSHSDGTAATSYSYSAAFEVVR